MTILGLGISLLSYSRKSRSLAGSVVQWGGSIGTPCGARLGQRRDFPASAETCLSGPQACVCSTASSRGFCLPRIVGSSPCPQGGGGVGGEPAPGRSQEDGCPGGFSPLRIPEASALLPEADLCSLGSHTGLSDRVCLVQVSFRGRTNNSKGSCLSIYFRVQKKKTDGELVEDSHSGCGWQGGPQFCKSSI